MSSAPPEGQGQAAGGGLHSRASAGATDVLHLLHQSPTTQQHAPCCQQADVGLWAQTAHQGGSSVSPLSPLCSPRHPLS